MRGGRVQRGRGGRRPYNNHRNQDNENTTYLSRRQRRAMNTTLNSKRPDSTDKLSYELGNFNTWDLKLKTKAAEKGVSDHLKANLEVIPNPGAKPIPNEIVTAPMESASIAQQVRIEAARKDYDYNFKQWKESHKLYEKFIKDGGIALQLIHDCLTSSMSNAYLSITTAYELYQQLDKDYNLRYANLKRDLEKEALNYCMTESMTMTEYIEGHRIMMDRVKAANLDIQLDKDTQCKRMIEGLNKIYLATAQTYINKQYNNVEECYNDLRTAARVQKEVGSDHRQSQQHHSPQANAANKGQRNNNKFNRGGYNNNNDNNRQRAQSGSRFQHGINRNNDHQHDEACLCWNRQKCRTKGKTPHPQGAPPLTQPEDTAAEPPGPSLQTYGSMPMPSRTESGTENVLR